MADFDLENTVTQLTEAVGDNADAKGILEAFSTEHKRMLDDGTKALSAVQGNLKETETATQKRIDELEESATKYGATITTLNSKIEGTEENSKALADLEAQAKVSAKTIEGLNGRLKAGVLGRLENYGIPKADTNDKSLEILEAMETGVVAVKGKAGSKDIPGGTGMSGGSGGDVSKLTPLELANKQIEDIVAAGEVRSGGKT
jgi:uncharacterized coiled-coil protein SlyX